MILNLWELPYLYCLKMAIEIGSDTKNRKCEKIYRENGHLAMLIFDFFCIKTPKNLTNLKNLTTSQKLTAKVKFEFLLFLLLLPFDTWSLLFGIS